MSIERHIDIQNLKKHAEFWALKQELEEFCGKMDSLQDINLEDGSRVTLAEELFGRRYASEKVRDLLGSLGLIDKKIQVRDKTME